MSLQVELITASSIETAALPEEYRAPGVDTHHITVEQFGIEAARYVQQRAHERPIKAAQQMFVLCAQNITVEAQNALLKLFEEPPKTTRFILIFPRRSLLLPTLRSRFAASAVQTSLVDSSLAREFLASNVATRLSTVAAATKEKRTKWMLQLVNELAAEETVRTDATATMVLAMVERYLHLTGASRKQLLEHLALSLPRA